VKQVIVPSVRATFALLHQHSKPATYQITYMYWLGRNTIGSLDDLAVRLENYLPTSLVVNQHNSQATGLHSQPRVKELGRLEV
jgi:hypothetical protein